MKENVQLLNVKKFWRKQHELENKITTIQKSMDYISEKQHFYADVLDGKTEYFSLLLSNENEWCDNLLLKKLNLLLKLLYKLLMVKILRGW